MMLRSHVSGGFWLQMPSDLAALVDNAAKLDIGLVCHDTSTADDGYNAVARLFVHAPHPLAKFGACPMP